MEIGSILGIVGAVVSVSTMVFTYFTVLHKDKRAVKIEYSEELRKALELSRERLAECERCCKESVARCVSQQEEIRVLTSALIKAGVIKA